VTIKKPQDKYNGLQGGHYNTAISIHIKNPTNNKNKAGIMQVCKMLTLKCFANNFAILQPPTLKSEISLQQQST